MLSDNGLGDVRAFGIRVDATSHMCECVQS